MMHSRIVLGLVVVAVAANCALAQQKPTPDTAKVAQPPQQVQNPPAGGNSWFPETTKDLGTFFGQGEGVGVFKFKNPHAKQVEWRSLTGSCQCTRAIVRVGGRTYELSSKPTPNKLTRVTKVPGQPDQTESVQQIAIEPNAEGEVEVHLDMTGVTTAKNASLDIHTTDETQPHVRLSFHAMGTQLFTVTPPEVNLNKMTFAETREFEVTVTSRVPDWKITRMDDAGKTFDVKWEKSADGKAWVIKGKYGPVDADAVGGGVLQFHTDVQGESAFSVRVLAMVVGPLDVKPGSFLTMGLIRKGTSLKREIVIEPNDGTQLAATGVKFEKMTCSTEFVSATTRQVGNKLVIELEVSDKAPVGLVKGDLVVGLNHPQVKEKRIVFNGFVR